MVQISVDKFTGLLQTGIPWRVDLDGEWFADVSEPGHDLSTDICAEVMDLRSGLFRLCRTSTFVGLIPTISDMTKEESTKFVYVSTHLAMTIASDLQPPFRPISFVWSHFVRKRLDRNDIFDTDPE